jgi:O-antigen ligase
LGEAALEVIKWAEVLVVLVILPEMVPPARVPWLVAVLLLGGNAQALFGLYQFIYRIGPDWFLILGRFMRASGSFHQPNPFAGYLGLTLPVALSLALWAWRSFSYQLSVISHQSRLTNHWSLVTDHWQRLSGALFYTSAAGLLAAGLIASWSRGGWLGAAVGIAAVVLMRSRQAAIMGAMATLLLVVALLVGSFSPTLLPAALRTRVQEIPTFLGLTDVLRAPVTDENFSVIERVAHWVAALRMWERSLWLGVGPGNYAVVYPEVHLLRWAEPLGHAHNIYLNVLAETGLVGFTFFLLLWVVILVAVWRQFRRAHQTGQTWQAALAVGVLGIIAHLSIHNFFDNLFVQGMYLHIALWLALLQTQTQSME